MAKSHELDMTSGSIFKNIVKYSIPLIISGILQTLYNAADIVVLGRFAGANALGAVGATSSLINLMVNLFIGLSVGTSVTVARNYGAKNYEGTQRALHTSIALSLICGIVSMLIGLLFSKTALQLMGTPKELIDMSALYMRIYFLGVPANIFYNFGAMAVRAVGDTKRPLQFLTISGIVNVVLNLIFVVGFKIDVAGVAIATAVSQYVAAALIFISLIKMHGYCHLELKKIKLHVKEVLEILKIGIPAGIQSVVFSISNVLVQSSVNSFGATTVSGSSAAGNIEGFVYVAMNSVHHAAVTMVGQNYGARKFDRIGKSVLSASVFVVSIGVVLTAVVLLFGKPILSIYSTDAAVIAEGMRRLKVVLTAYILCGLMEVFVGGTRGLGNSFLTMIVSIVGVCGSRILWIFTIFRMNHDFEVLLLSYPVSWAITGAIQLICFIVYKNRVIKKNKM